MRRKPVRMTAGVGGDPRWSAPARAARTLWVAALAVAAALALPASATSAIPAGRPASMHSVPGFEPCPCADPLCKPVCSQL
jgi:hypothetical protein